MKPLLSKSTKIQVGEVIKKFPHALGIVGPQGSGKAYIANYIAKEITGVNNVNANENILILRPNEKKVITIDDARELTRFVKLKTPSKKAIRIAVIEDAEYMTNQAQNAILKTIEELPVNTIMIMTFSSKSSVIETILSRLNVIEVSAPSLTDAVEFYMPEYPEDEITKSYKMSGGRTGLMEALMRDGEHKMHASISTAKELLSKSKYERLCMVETLSKQDLYEVLEGLSVVSEAVFRNSVSGGRSQTKKLAKIRTKIHQTSSILKYQPNNKLLLTDLLLEI